ncbi:MAG: molybdenum cofactor guanylyltransferase [Anaerohalosphaera sp.]|nr:molybdenum cofactor guanylyltransferase [Anaerohalosphaera sp.]
MEVRSKNLKIAAAILAGGKARRMGGVPKGTIESDKGVAIVERLINELARSGIENIVISANDPENYEKFGLKIIADTRTDVGPIGGIESTMAFFADRSDAVMFMPCDMPNIKEKEISALKDFFIETDSKIVFAKTEGFFWHPLCAVVHNDLKGLISSAIDSGHRKVTDVWRQLNAASVSFPDENAFINLNDPSDMDRWRKGVELKTIFCTDLSEAKQIGQFLESNKIDIEVVTCPEGDIEVKRSENRLESNLNILHAGGWITCATAHNLAAKMNVSLEQTGKLLDHLDVKISRCSLGCFK